MLDLLVAPKPCTLQYAIVKFPKKVMSWLVFVYTVQHLKTTSTTKKHACFISPFVLLVLLLIWLVWPLGLGRVVDHILSFSRTYTMRCHYNTVNFLQSSHNRHSIARPYGRGMGCLLWVLQSDSCSIPTTAVLHVIWCYIAPPYNGTRLYFAVHLCLFWTWKGRQFPCFQLSTNSTNFVSTHFLIPILFVGVIPAFLYILRLQLLDRWLEWWFCLDN